MYYHSIPHIVVQINTVDDDQLIREKVPTGYYTNTPRLPAYVRITVDRSACIGHLSDVLNAGPEYINTYNNGISVVEFLNLEDLSKPSMEFW